MLSSSHHSVHAHIWIAPQVGQFSRYDFELRSLHLTYIRKLFFVCDQDTPFLLMFTFSILFLLSTRTRPGAVTLDPIRRKFTARCIQLYGFLVIHVRWNWISDYDTWLLSSFTVINPPTVLPNRGRIARQKRKNSLVTRIFTKSQQLYDLTGTWHELSPCHQRCDTLVISCIFARLFLKVILIRVDYYLLLFHVREEKRFSLLVVALAGDG